MRVSFVLVLVRRTLGVGTIEPRAARFDLLYPGRLLRSAHDVLGGLRFSKIQSVLGSIKVKPAE